MPEEVSFEVQRRHERWFSWLPTSMALLREAEHNILKYLKVSYRGFFVNIGKVVNNEENEIRTVIANETSKKTPLVLVHGFGIGNAIWFLNYNSLANNRPVYAFDLLGFGCSSRPSFSKEPLEAEAEFVNSIEAWRKNMKLDKFILLGHSFGGFLATSYAIKYPDRILHLILADPWGFSDRPLDEETKKRIPLRYRFLGYLLQSVNPLSAVRAAGPWGPALVKKARPDLVRKFSHKLENAEEYIPDYIYHCNAQHPSGETAFHEMVHNFGRAKYPMVHRMNSLNKKVPITFIFGSRSWIDKDPGFQIQSMRQKSYVNVQIVQGAGHHVYADKATNFNRIVNDIAAHTDNGTLAPLADVSDEEKEEKFDILNVRTDTTCDNSADPSHKLN